MKGDLLLINQNFSADTITNTMVKIPAKDSITNVQGSFLHTGGKVFEAHHPFFVGSPAPVAGQDWIFYVLISVVVLFAFIRYYFPDDLKVLLLVFRRNPIAQESESTGKRSFVVTLFLFVNYLINTGLLFIAVNQKYHPFNTFTITVFDLFLIASLVVLGYYLFNKIIILIIGFIFGTIKQARWHAKKGAGLAYVMGIALLPFLLFYFFTGLDLLLYIAVIVVVVAVLFKWSLLLRSSYSINKFTIFHNILYLCALEIIPIMLLIKVGMIYA